MNPVRSTDHATGLGVRGTDRSANDEQPSAHPQILVMLDAALATELTSLLRCRRHHFAAHWSEARAIAVMFLVHSVLAQRNADGLAGRIVELGGTPDFAPESLPRRSHTQYLDEATLDGMVRDSVAAERLAIHRYRRCIELLEDRDVRTSQLLRSIVLTSVSFAGELESSAGPP